MCFLSSTAVGQEFQLSASYTERKDQEGKDQQERIFHSFNKYLTRSCNELYCVPLWGMLECKGSMTTASALTQPVAGEKQMKVRR